MAEQVVQGFTREEIEYLQEMSRHKRLMDIQEEECERRERMEQARAKGHAEGRMEGHAEGHMEGHMEGHAKGRVEGKAEGRTKGRAEIYRELEQLSQKGVSFEEALRILKATE